MKKAMMVLLVALVAVGLIFAQGAQEGKTTEKIKIGALIRNLNETFVRDYTDNLYALAEKAGVEIYVQDANSDVDKQISQLDTMISQGYKYFVIIPQDTSATELMCEKINAVGGAAAFSNIQPSVDALKVGKNFFLASSPEQVAGQYQAEIAIEYFTKYPEKAPGKVINVLYINGQLGHPAQVNRRAGFVNTLEAKGWTVNFVAEDTANWGAEQAQQKMDAWVTAFDGKYNLVVAQNDDMALGAIESLIQNGKVKADTSDGTRLLVPVLGVDATATGCASIDRDEMYATVLQDAIGQSTTAFEIVLNIAQGNSPDGFVAGGIAPATTTIDEEPANDPTIISQCYLVPFKPVTKENYKDYM